MKEGNVWIGGYQRFGSWGKKYCYGLLEAMITMLTLACPVGLRRISAASLRAGDGEADAVETVEVPEYDS
jgi:hypothetical protein